MFKFPFSSPSANFPLDDIENFPNPATSAEPSMLDTVMTVGGMLGRTTIMGLPGMLVGQPKKPSGPHFQFHKRRSGGKHAVIFINGFMTKGDLDVSDWEDALKRRFGEATWYHLDWETTRGPKDYLVDLISFDTLRDFTPSIRLLELVGAWHSAMESAQEAGELLAQAIMRTPGWRFTLAGHSLGARVIHYALKYLAEHSSVCVENVYLLGGAVGGGAKDNRCWTSAVGAVEGHIFNCYSEHDSTLSYLYRGANMMLSKPIGFSGIVLQHPRIVAFDAQDLVYGHTSWKEHFGAIIERLSRRIA